MRYGMLVAMLLAVFLVGGTCFPLLRLDDSGIHLGPDDDSTTSGSVLSVSVIAPAVSREVWMGTAVEIEWTASNRTDSSAVETVLVRAREDLAETILAGGLRISEVGGTRLVEWDTSDFSVGEYEIIVRIEAGDQTGEDVAPGRITINTRPEFEFTEPLEDTELVRKPDPNDPDGPLLSARLTIGWTGFDPDEDATAELRIDPIDPNDPNDPFEGSTAFDPNEPFDPDLANRPDYESGDEITIARLELPTTEDPNSLEWDGRDSSGNPVDSGDYLLFAVVSDRVGERTKFLCKGVDGRGRCRPVQLSVPEPIDTELTIVRVESKWQQPPLTNPGSSKPGCFWGWDDLSEYDDPNQPIVADDWIAADDRPISQIQWWGSYRGWNSEQRPASRVTRFHIGIWSGSPPDVDGSGDFAHPDELLWQSWAKAGEFTEHYVGCDYHPDFMSSRESCFHYTYDVPESKWFHQDPNEEVYWVSISARYASADPPYPWGWTTRARDPNSFAAVRIFEIDPNDAAVPGAQYSQGELIRSADSDDAWDLAFALEVTETRRDVEFLTADDPLTLKFTLDEDDDVFVDLRIDTDEDHDNGNEVSILRRYLVEKGTNTDSHEWEGDDADGEAVGDGIYRPFMVIDRGSGQPQTVEAEGRVLRRHDEQQPLITLLEPAVDKTFTTGSGEQVLIRWDDDDPSESARIRLAIDDDPNWDEDSETDGPEEVLPSADWDDLPAAGGGVQNTFRYPIGDLEAGRYWVFAYIDRDQVPDWDNVSVTGGQIVIEDPN